MHRLFNFPSYRPPDELPSRAASNWLLLSVAFAVAPHAERLPVWLLLTVAGGLVWRFGIDNHGWRIPPRWLRLVLLAAVMLGILKTYGTLFGREVGVALLAAAVGLKVLEIRRLRDYMITVYLVYFLLLGAFLYSQSMLTAAYGVAVALLTTASLVLLNNPQRLSGQVWRLLGRIMMFGLPLCLVMYLFFPRIEGSLWGLPSDAFGSRTGLSDHIELGGFTALSTDTTPVFRVSFAAAPPPPKDRYWRVYVLSDNDGDGGWRRRTMTVFDGGRPGDFKGKGPPIHYTVTLEPTHQHWLPVLDLPLKTPAGAVPRYGFLVGASQPVNHVIRYSGVSQRVARTPPLNILQRRANLQMENAPSPRVLRLLDSWRDLAPAAKVKAALAFFRDHGFRYTLTPPTLQGDRIDEFLFDTRAGYCEHYASAFVSLMRWSGVPARVVAGYQGGEWNDSGGYLTLEQSDAHAWAEVWLPGRGWSRVDPTAAVAPERIELGAEAIRLLLARGASPGQLSEAEARRLIALSWFQRSWLHASWAWDNVNYKWDTWVMGYGPALQRELLHWLGFATPTWTRMVAAMSAGLSLLLLVAGLAVTRRRSREDPVLRLYRRALRKLARFGPRKSPVEGPRAFQRRLERESPELARRLKPVTEMYIALRYGSGTDATTRAFRTLVAKF